MARCSHVTAASTLAHVPALQALHSYGTDLAPGVLSACRARGCAVPAAGVLRGHRHEVWSLVLLADGRLASGDERGKVRLWDVAAGGGEADVIFKARHVAAALAVLRDGHRLAVGVLFGNMEIWEVGVVPPVRMTTVDCGDGGVRAMVVLHDGHLAAGCEDGRVRIIDVEAGAVAAKLEGHTGRVPVMALAMLPDGTLASGSWEGRVGVWDMGARACVATLAGHGASIRALVVLVDGRPAGRTTARYGCGIWGRAPVSAYWLGMRAA